MEELYSYLFWYNPHENLWYAIERDDVLKFFNGHRNEVSFLKSKQHSTLVELICKKDILKKINI